MQQGEEIEGVSCTVIRQESTLDEVLDEICRYDSERYGALRGEEADTGAAFTLFRRAVGELLADMGPLPGNRCPDRYSYGFLDDLVSEARAMDRVLYLQFPVTVPAGGDVSVSASLWKAPSHDFDCSGSENVGIQGYDMVHGPGQQPALHPPDSRPCERGRRGNRPAELRLRPGRRRLPGGTGHGAGALLPGDPGTGGGLTAWLRHENFAEIIVYNR